MYKTPHNSELSHKTKIYLDDISFSIKLIIGIIITYAAYSFVTIGQVKSNPYVPKMIVFVLYSLNSYHFSRHASLIMTL